MTTTIALIIIIGIMAVCWIAFVVIYWRRSFILGCNLVGIKWSIRNLARNVDYDNSMAMHLLSVQNQQDGDKLGADPQDIAPIFTEPTKLTLPEIAEQLGDIHKRLAALI